MQALDREHWRRSAILNSDDEPEATGDHGWYTGREYALTTCQIAVMSNYACLPREGGLDEQDYYWTLDLLTYLKGLHRARWEQAHPQEAVVSLEHNKAPDWSEVF
jgi:hypothetical protein